MNSATLGLYGLVLLPPLLLLLATLLSWLLPQRLHLQPLLANWAEQLQRKTHHPRRSSGQRTVAGGLGLLLMAAPLLLLSALAIWHPLLELALLTLLLPSRELPGSALAQQLQQGQKEQARATLSQWALRDTQPLSSLGITKAAIELQLERRASQFFGVSFWYLLGGMPLAMALWISTEVARHWHIDKPQLAPFGGTAHFSAALMMLPVNGLLGLFLSLYGVLARPWQLRPQLQGRWDQRSQQWLQLCLACSLGVQLGGPWQLAGKRLLRPRLGPQQQCQPLHLQRAQRMLTMAQTLWLLLPLLAAIALAWFWHQSR
ncbi:cobalamin biosynthesis protein [uncultured Ferrimonas sp.]|uniref:cobalamin biosynthesis protein n=1 Tax=uncultured Ferrimonas sp. TaxID=432640 RepID=UPI0026297083|nr:cobalamin biosynthesis protein [uncultured Ferrimonas sp.]